MGRWAPVGDMAEAAIDISEEAARSVDSTSVCVSVDHYIFYTYPHI
jgi:hypothetical protein